MTVTTLVQLDNTVLFLPEGVASADAVWGYIPRFLDQSRLQLDSVWQQNNGYFVFFPAEQRADWNGFAQTLKNQMAAGSGNRRFGFFTASGVGLNYISVSGSGNQQYLAPGTDGSTVFDLRNINLHVFAPSGTQVPVSLDGDVFIIDSTAKNGAQSVWLSASAGGTGTEQTMTPTGQLRIPGSGTTPGSLSMDLQLSLTDQAALETGPMYFAPPEDGAIVACRFPTFIASTGKDDPVAITQYIDPALQLDPVRTYFELTDAELGTTFTSTNGRQLVATPLSADVDPDGVTARFVLSDRPVTAVGDDAAYFLTPYGSFELTPTDGTEPGQLICGYSATETFSFSSGDTLRFQPGHAAYAESTPESTDDGTTTPASYLSTKATTSWLSLSSTAAQNTYFSQPQGSPLFESNGATGGGGNVAYQLKFKEIQAWPALGSALADAADPVATALVPMVPYGGVTAADAAQYETIESKAINPQRRAELKALSGVGGFAPRARLDLASADETLTPNLTPLGVIGGFDAQNLWKQTTFALSGAKNDRILQFEDMQAPLREALYQNQIFMVIDQNASDGQPLFTFGADDATVELAEWFFDLQLQGENPDGVPPIVILKFFRDKSISDLVDDLAVWESATTFSSDPSTRQTQIQAIIAAAVEEAQNDNSPYANFVKAVQDPAFTGLIALNCALQLDALPAAIRALLGGMTKADGSSNIAAFRAHHVGVQINDTGNSADIELNTSSLFALVDYKDDGDDEGDAAKAQPRDEALALATDSIFPCGTNGLQCYGFKVIFLRALFENNALTDFAAQVDLTVNNLFAVGVNLGGSGAGDGDDDENIVKITGSYSEHDGAQTYSFVAEKEYEFTFEDNTYLKKLTFEKVQFSATEDEGGDTSDAADGGTTSTITSRFAIWGNMEFNKLDFLDMFSFEKLSFADLGITMSYVLQTFTGGKDPETSDLSLGFSPGNLRFDLADSKQRDDSDSMLALLPFKLKSFLYSEKGQAISELNYFGVGLELDNAPDTDPTFNFALIFDLDLGSLGGLVGSLSAFKFSVLLGWQPPSGSTPNALVFGIQMPEADGKLEINIEGVLKISIEKFVLKWVDGTDENLLVVGLKNSYMEVLGTRMPPGNIVFDFALFAPSTDRAKIGWIAAFNDAGDGEEAFVLPEQIAEDPISAVQMLKADDGGDGGDGGGDDQQSSLFKLDYLGVGQRVGPDADDTPTDFEGFLTYMKEDFWTAFEKGDYTTVYQPSGGWIVVANFELLEAVGLGFVFYDTTPFYALTIRVLKAPLTGLSFEITYTKVSDDVGLFFINFTLPDLLRTFQAGAASITLPSLKLSIYTNGDFKIDLGFPANDDWSGSFRVQAFAGPVPVTGSGGFYLAKLSSATDDVFKADDYATIIAGGFGVRLGVGKDFTSGPLKAGVSLTFFGIIEGALGYYAYDEATDGDIVKYLTQPKALSLKGQFGVIGELYGSLDFAIVKASVNVKIQGSVGVELLLEAGIGGDILLYVEASVEASVSVKISLGFFSVKVSFSFKASFRFEWHLLDSDNANANARLDRYGVRALAVSPGWNPTYPLQTDLNKNLSTWMTPELTTVWTDTSVAGEPWFVTSLTMEYVDDAASIQSASDFNSFETMAAQMVSWALNAAIGLESWKSAIHQDDLDILNQTPDVLVGGLTYATLLDGLGQMFALAIESIPPDDGSLSDEAKETKYATIFPMLPFLRLKTNGRSQDLDYVFQDKSNVSDAWVAGELQAYFEQLYTNITSDGDDPALFALADSTTPLSQYLFLDWFQAVVRATVNALLTQMQNDDTTEGTLEDVFLAAAKSGQIKNVAGQMSQYFRSGLRLPKTDGMELPDGAALQDTNPLYALVWQEFAVGPVDDSYTVTLKGDDTQPWVTVDGTWKVLASDVTPYAIKGTEIDVPTTPTAIPVLQSGPRAFSLTNATTWTPTGGTATTVRPVSSSFAEAIATETGLDVKVLSRPTGKAYDTDVQTVPTDDVTWALSIEMTIRKVPAIAGGDLPDTYALGAASLTVQNQMRALLDALAKDSTLVSSISLLYQESADSSGLVSSPDPKELFVLRTNTTTQSVPPPTVADARLLVDTQTTAVGAGTDNPYGFLQILEQSSVTNQTGYFFTYQAADGSSLPSDLFGQQTFANVTFLFELKLPLASGVFTMAPYANAVVLDDTDSDRLYYAESTDPDDYSVQVSMAAGATGVSLTRAEPGESTVADKLAALYSLVAYQVPASTGFIASNLSVPSGPQKEEEGDTEQTWRLVVPLYNLATDNQGASDPNRYASIGDTYSVETVVVDAFGNMFGSPTTAIDQASNLYFDDIVPMGNWVGVHSEFNFEAAGGSPEAGKLTVNLSASADTLPTPGSQAAQAAATLYQSVIDQLQGPSVVQFITTNLDSTGSDIALSAAQSTAVLTMLKAVLAYLQGTGSGTIAPVGLTVAVPGDPSATGLVFELQVDFGIKRTAHLAPEVADYPAASRALTSVPPEDTTNNLTGFAADFSVAFPMFSLAVGPADATDVRVAAATTALAAEADDGQGSSGGPQGLWAVSTAVTDLTMSGSVRHYQAPAPLDNRLRSGTVPMPNALPALSTLPDERTFSDVDLDDLARTAFNAIDSILEAENASETFQTDSTAYTQIAYAREQIADRYADNQVGWLLDDARFIGTDTDLCQGRDQMAQQMRAALGSAYKVDTIVQTDVTFNQALPDSMGNRLQLFGQMQRADKEVEGKDQDAGGFGLGTARVDVPAGNGGQSAVTTFLYGVSDTKLESTGSETLNLEWAVTHLQVFLEDRTLDYCTRDAEAPPSVWLQLVNAFKTPPSMGETIIPLPYREYPTPPTAVTQTAERDTTNVGTTLAAQTRWVYSTTYQAQLLSRDEITLALVYNTGFESDGGDAAARLADEETYTLFESLARFQAAYVVLQPSLTPVTDATTADQLNAFATLVQQIADNSDWNPVALDAMAVSDQPKPTTEFDVVTDVAKDADGESDTRIMTLSPDPLMTTNNTWVGDKCLNALNPTTMKPYGTATCSVPGETSVQHEYDPEPPLVGNFVTHKITVQGLTTLEYENGNSGIGTRRNANLYPDASVLSNSAFIYQTPVVAFTNPVTPYVDNPTPIAIYPTVVPDLDQDLGVYVADTLKAMMGVSNDPDALRANPSSAVEFRRLKIDARFGFPIGSPSGMNDQTDAFLPLLPAVLVRSFDLPVSGLADAIDAWVGTTGPSEDDPAPYAVVLADWIEAQSLAFGKDATPAGAMLVFDVTLYSRVGAGQTSANQVPLLRLSQLRLPLSVVAPPPTETAKTKKTTELTTSPPPEVNWNDGRRFCLTGEARLVAKTLTPGQLYGIFVLKEGRDPRPVKLNVFWSYSQPNAILTVPAAGQGSSPMALGFISGSDTSMLKVWLDNPDDSVTIWLGSVSMPWNDNGIDNQEIPLDGTPQPVGPFDRYWCVPPSRDYIATVRGDTQQAVVVRFLEQSAEVIVVNQPPTGTSSKQLTNIGPTASAPDAVLLTAVTSSTTQIDLTGNGSQWVWMSATPTTTGATLSIKPKPR